MDSNNTPNLPTAVVTAINVLSAVAPELPAVVALANLAVSLISENRDPTPDEWAGVISSLDNAHTSAQEALASVQAQANTAAAIKAAASASPVISRPITP